MNTSLCKLKKCNSYLKATVLNQHWKRYQEKNRIICSEIAIFASAYAKKH
jgi:hypothetical protein